MTVTNESVKPTPDPSLDPEYPRPEGNYNSEDFLSTALGNPESQAKDPDWTFDVQRDGGNYGLNDWQCQAAFPQLYAELNRALAYRHAEGNITIEDLDISWRDRGLVRAMIYDREV